MKETSTDHDAMPRLQLLGMPGFGEGAGAQPRLGHKPMILLTRLVLETRPVAREALMAFLWPEATESRARGSLRQALHVIREVIGDDGIVADRRAVGLRILPRCDLVDFLTAVRNSDWPQAARSYGGPLLDGVTVADATDAELWLDFERRRMAKLFETAATAALKDDRSRDQRPDRLDVARRFRDQNPRLVSSWRFLLDELSQGNASSELQLECAALSARVETGQIDDPRGASEILDPSWEPEGAASTLHATVPPSP